MKNHENHNKSALIQNIFQTIRKKQSNAAYERGEEDKKDTTLPLIQPNILKHMHENKAEESCEEG